MKNTIALFVMLFTTLVYSQQVMMKTVTDIRKIEMNKSEFIGKPLAYLLSNIKPKVEWIMPIPNKAPDKIHSLSLVFVSYDVYNEDSEKDHPEIIVFFNQNPHLGGEKCSFDNPHCIQWTKTDEQNLGNLIIHNIYVYGKETKSSSNSNIPEKSMDLN